jgi:hypothetical protein
MVECKCKYSDVAAADMVVLSAELEEKGLQVPIAYNVIS